MNVAKLTVIPKTTFPGISKGLTKVNMRNVDADMAGDVIKESLNITNVQPEHDFFESEMEEKIVQENFNKMAANNAAKKEYLRARDYINVHLDDYRKG
ncbi:MAG: hypothetical protein LKG27_02280 [Clostridiaceae bacterium]|jgi:hypothetical protein|nr:hypothetical protein [Clostridiaceae bacterium]